MYECDDVMSNDWINAIERYLEAKMNEFVNVMNPKMTREELVG